MNACRGTDRQTVLRGSRFRGRRPNRGGAVRSAQGRASLLTLGVVALLVIAGVIAIVSFSTRFFMAGQQTPVRFAGSPILTIDLQGVARAERTTAYGSLISGLESRFASGTQGSVRIERGKSAGVWKVSVTPGSGPGSGRSLLIAEQFDQAFDATRVIWTAIVSTQSSERAWTSVGTDPTFSHNVNSVWGPQVRAWLADWLPSLDANHPLRRARFFVDSAEITPPNLTPSELENAPSGPAAAPELSTERRGSRSTRSRASLASVHRPDQDRPVSRTRRRPDA